MLAQYLVLHLLLTLFTHTAHTQVCSVTEEVTKRVTSMVTFTESYLTRCYIYTFHQHVDCYKMRQASRLQTKNVTLNETRSVCCDGYEMVSNNSTDSSNATDTSEVVCEPVCSASCKCEGCRCSAPSECGCRPGYTPHPNSSKYCRPECDACERGTCTAPNTCHCHSGYKLLNGTCRPACTDSCRHGTCLDTGHCQCDHGYNNTENGTCIAHVVEKSAVSSSASWWSRWWWCVVAPVVVVLCGALVLALRRRQGPLVACFAGDASEGRLRNLRMRFKRK
ncbi:uncharacterized protein LOC142982161 isoform X2 [Anticarsia gemmatalis]|uniref:uncharacterized protein LOC142982161 isoform X2 n=1 Tax=Anticarsia gemmatalis TaxID=129554 RepID=UPI003F766117